MHTESSAQVPGEWTWMHGDSAANTSGIFGTMGIPSPTNKPPSLYESACWKDLSGNFWLFGGGRNTSPRCDMWRFNPATNEWTWMHGPGNGIIKGIYGTQGVPAPTNRPGGRGWGMAAWTSLNGDLWLFGGQGRDSANDFGHMNDLWKYNITTNEWTWMSGSPVWGDSGSYGIMGVPSLTNCPPARSEIRCSWVDSNGDFYLTAGYLYDAFTRNDVWKYIVATNEWVWLRGSNVPVTTGNYGIKGVSSPLNEPPPHWIHSNWTDAAKNFWMFGGRIGAGGYGSDLWKYNPLTNEWTWMSGPSALWDAGNYGTLCISDSLFFPQCRHESSYYWMDYDNFYIFGGIGLNDLADIWQYNISSNKWRLIRGTSQNTLSDWGTLGVSAPSNEPGSRGGGSTWVDNQGNFWLFGGLAANNSDYLSDMWRYVPDSNCTGVSPNQVHASFTSQQEICPGTCINFLNLSVNANTYQWFFPGATTTSSTDVNPSGICYNNPGSFDVMLLATGNTNDTLLMTDYITVFQQPAPQSIMQNGDTLFANTGATSYQWYFNGNSISGATNYFHVALASGDYNVVATDSNGCEVEAVINNVLAQTPLVVGYWPMTIYPNPVIDKLIIYKSQVTRGTAIAISIYNMIGEKAMDVSPLSLGEGPGGEVVNCQNLPAGIFYIEITSDKKIYRAKFIKQ